MQIDTHTFRSTSFLFENERFLPFWPNPSRTSTTVEQEMTKYTQFEQYQIKEYSEVIMLDISVRKRVARSLCNMDMRKLQGRHAKDGRIARDGGCGQFDIRYASSRAVLYRQYRSASIDVGSKGRYMQGYTNTTTEPLATRAIRKIHL